MIHDILLSCLSASRNGLGIKSFLASDAVEHFIHPCERGIFLEILNIINCMQEVAEFTKSFGLNEKKTEQVANDEADSKCGFYLVQFAHGVENGVEDYYTELIRLESSCSQKKANSLVYVYNALQIQMPVIMLLRKLIREVKIQKLYGCALLHNLHQHSEHGDPQLDRMMTKVLKPVKMTFYSHLAHWILFGVLDDVHSEFFIKFTPQATDDTSLCSTRASSDITPLNMGNNAEDYIWQYEIDMNQLPGFLSIIIADKILFVGQTVLIFKIHRSSKNKYSIDTWPIKFEDTSHDDISELWNGKEELFYKMIEGLNDYDKINVFHIERVINEIKKYVSTRLSEIAINETDLVRQMGLIKDFYLLGRGEFYMEFFYQIKRFASEGESEVNPRSYVKAFECAAASMGISEDLENFTLSVQKSSFDLDESCEFEVLKNIHLKYISKFPLNLLFSPKIIERYNKVFQFLLIVRKLQKELQDVWANQTWAAKTIGPVNTKILNLRNHLLFFLDNMQFYIQVDVLESQFSILMKIIKSGADFEEIQKSHTIFLANVLSQCFLLSENDSKMNISDTVCQTKNPIYGTILALLNLCEKFSNLSATLDPNDKLIEEMDILEDSFNVLIASLVQLLVDIKTASILGPLSQLLLRLDYNYWFSADHNGSQANSVSS